MSLNKGSSYAKDVAPVFNGDEMPTSYGWAILGNDSISVDVVSDPSDSQVSRDELPSFMRHRGIQVRSNDTGISLSYDSDDIDDESWTNPDNWTFSSEKINITATISGAGITKGDVFENLSPQQMWEAAFAPYVAPVLGGIVVTPGSTVEVGATITPTSYNLSWTKDSEGNVPYNADIYEPLGVSEEVYLGDGTSITMTLSGASPITRTTAGSEQWTFTATDKDGKSIPSVYDRVYWYWRRFFGASSLEVTDDASAQTLIESLQQSWLDANKAGTVTCTSDNASASKFTYIAYEASMGDLSTVIQNGADSILGAFTKVGSFSYTNSENVTTDYIVYKTNSEGAFADGDTLAIS